MDDPIVDVAKPASLLTRDETLSVAWIKIRAHCEQELIDLHQQLEGDLPIEKTAKLRGQIVQIRKLLALGFED